VPIQNNIPRKNNTVPTRTPLTSPFPGPPKGHETVLAYPGLDYNSPFTDADTAPLASQMDIATQPQYPALRGVAGHITPLHAFVRLSPVEKAVSYSPNIHPSRPPVHRAGGPSAHTNTPFHPKQVKAVPIPVLQPSVTTEKRTTGAAVATGQNKSNHSVVGRAPVAVGSFLHTGGSRTLSSHPYADTGTSRWNTIKRGAGDSAA
jgi:hypothetical protein